MLLRNRNPLGDVDVPLIGRQGGRVLDDDGVAVSGHLVTGEEFEATPEQAAILLRQVDNYEPVDDEAVQLAADIAAEEQPAETPDAIEAGLAAGSGEPPAGDDADDDDPAGSSSTGTKGRRRSPAGKKGEGQ